MRSDRSHKLKRALKEPRKVTPTLRVMVVGRVDSTQEPTAQHWIDERQNGNSGGPCQPSTRWASTNGKIFTGVITQDSSEALEKLPPNVFNVVVTSPPYYWGRDYGIDGQIGHEESVEAYIKSLIAVFEKVRRVLHPQGVFYLNIGDSYYSGNGQPHGSDPRSSSRNFIRNKMRPLDMSGWSIPKKSLIGIPWRLAFALQECGWTLRSDIIWNRVNAFAEPTARDRPHRQYEHLFLLSKSRFYAYDRSSLDGEENIWNIPIGRDRANGHHAQFPDDLVSKCLTTGSPIGGWVLDPFVGSGTTIEVAAKLGRNSVGIDLHPDYTSRIRERVGGCSVPWDSALEAMKLTPPEWESWSGNPKNLPKPRRPNTS